MLHQVSRVTVPIATSVAKRSIAFHQVTPGARPAVAGVPVTVLGATGFVGRYVVNAIGKTGSQVIVPYRGNDYSYRHLKLCGDLGQIVPIPFHPKKIDTISRAIEHSDIVINLMGRNYKTSNFSFNDVNVKLAQDVAKACKQAGVQRLIHVSALASDKNAPSEWARTKAHGEDAVRAEFPDATIIRPAHIFGLEDRLIQKEAAIAKFFPIFPVFSARAKLQPTYVVDVAMAILNAARDGGAKGKTYDLAGPKVYTRLSLMQEILEVAGLWRARPFELPNIAGALPAWFVEKIPIIEPYITRDMLLQYQQDVVVDETDPHANEGYSALDVIPQSFSKHAVVMLRRFRPPKAHIGFEVTSESPEAPEVPADLEAREIALGPFKRLDYHKELRSMRN